jgi:hypothetical protein
MKTTYRVKNEHGEPIAFAGTDGVGVDFLRENHRQPGNTLWRRTDEDEASADKRRLDWISATQKRGASCHFYQGSHDVRAACDTNSSPPAPTETELDWDTLEPLPQVWTWQPNGLVWIASIRPPGSGNSDPFDDVCFGRFATGATEQSAIRNLREIQAAIKALK